MKHFTVMTLDENLNRGSYRVWTNQIVKRLKQMGHGVSLNSYPIDQAPDAVIFDKSVASHLPRADYYRKESGCNKIVAINPTAKQAKYADAVIVGSPEEKFSIESESDCHACVINLIEDLFRAAPMKFHEDKDRLCLLYHGSSTHVNKLRGIIPVLQGDSRYYMKFIVNNTEFVDSWMKKHGSGIDYSTVGYNHKTVAKEMLEGDIGLVPTVNVIPTSGKVDSQNGLYDTDLVLRFKNKTNAGRAFPFFQLGIPVIGDLGTSLAPMLHDSKCGSIASNELTYRRALDRFSNTETRREVAVLAAARFKSLYDFDRDINEFLEKEIFNE